MLWKPRRDKVFCLKPFIKNNFPGNPDAEYTKKLLQSIIAAVPVNIKRAVTNHRHPVDDIHDGSHHDDHRRGGSDGDTKGADILFHSNTRLRLIPT